MIHRYCISLHNMRTYICIYIAINVCHIYIHNNLLNQKQLCIVYIYLYDYTYIYVYIYMYAYIWRLTTVAHLQWKTLRDADWITCASQLLVSWSGCLVFLVSQNTSWDRSQLLPKQNKQTLVEGYQCRKKSRYCRHLFDVAYWSSKVGALKVPQRQ